MILFFDRSVSKVVPSILRDKELKFPLQIEYHQLYFPQDALDDTWLPVVGTWGWTVIGHDRYHVKPNELSAIRQYDVGCFYLWGSENSRWEKLQCFARAFDRIVEAESRTPKPFIYDMNQRGLLKQIL